MIATYLITDYDAVMALPEPKHVWIDGNTIRVYTGADIPPSPSAVPVMIEESVAIAAVKAAGKSEAEAKALLRDAKGEK